MKFLFRPMLTIVAWMIFLSSEGQDLIVTNKLDSLNVKISSSNTTSTFFLDRISGVQGELDNNAILYSAKNFYYIDRNEKTQKPIFSIGKNQIVIGTGISRKFAQVETPFLMNQTGQTHLKEGFEFLGDYHYFVFENHGFGFALNWYPNSFSLGLREQGDFFAVTRSFRLNGKTNMILFAPSYSYQYHVRNVLFHLKTHVGYLSYSEEGSYYLARGDYKLNGGTFAGRASLGCVLPIPNFFRVGLTVGYLVSKYGDYDLVFEGESLVANSQPEFPNLNTLDVSLVLMLDW